MKIYVDDVRPAPFGWTLAKTAVEAIDLIRLALESDDFEAISLDHDLEPEHYDRALLDKADADGTYESFRPPRTGYDVATWMISNLAFPPIIVLHTMNPVGRADMFRAFDRAREEVLVDDQAQIQGLNLAYDIHVIVGFRRGYEHADPTTRISP